VAASALKSRAPAIPCRQSICRWPGDPAIWPATAIQRINLNPDGGIKESVKTARTGTTPLSALEPGAAEGTACDMAFYFQIVIWKFTENGW